MNNDPKFQPTESEIAERALQLYKAGGCVEGRALDHWLDAERQLRAEKSVSQGPLKESAAPPSVRKRKARS